MNSRDTSPVGFPASDVFAFDESVFSGLEIEWRQERRTNRETWGKLRRFRYEEAAN